MFYYYFPNIFLTILVYLATGAIIGWIASLIVSSRLNLFWSIIIGIVGSFVGGFLASLFGLYGIWWALLFSIVGAVLLLLLAKAIARPTA